MSDYVQNISRLFTSGATLYLYVSAGSIIRNTIFKYTIEKEQAMKIKFQDSVEAYAGASAYEQGQAISAVNSKLKNDIHNKVTWNVCYTSR
jgi:hypothetical protein